METCKLVFYANSQVNLTVNQKMSGMGENIMPDSLDQYELEEGIYSYFAEQNGYYSFRRTFAITADDVKRGTKTIEVHMDKMAGTGYESVTWIFSYSDEIEKNLFSLDSLKEYHGEIKTPTLNTKAVQLKAANQFTTNEETWDYIKELEEKCNHMKVYDFLNDGTTPAVFCSKNDMTENLSETMAETSHDDLPLVFIQGQIHGNEPASGEGALALIEKLAGVYGKTMIEKMDILIIPCANPFGAKDFNRLTAEGINLNRDAIALEHPYTRMLHMIFNIRMPHIIVDGHEAMKRVKRCNEGTITGLEDCQICGQYGNYNLPEEVVKHTEIIIDKMLVEFHREGIRSFLFESSAYYASLNGYSGLMGSCYILIESLGLHMGKAHFERRTYTQLRGMEIVLDYVFNNGQRMLKDIEQSRTIIADDCMPGSKKAFCLKHKKSGHIYKEVMRPEFRDDGEPFDMCRTEEVKKYDKPIRFRKIPEAYAIIPKDSVDRKSIDIIIEKLAGNGIKTFKLNKAQALWVRGYRGTVDKATLGIIRRKKLPEGSLIIPTKQRARLLIAATLEPDINDGHLKSAPISLAQMGIIEMDNIFRINSYEEFLKKDNY